MLLVNFFKECWNGLLPSVIGCCVVTIILLKVGHRMFNELNKKIYAGRVIMLFIFQTALITVFIDVEYDIVFTMQYIVIGNTILFTIEAYCGFFSKK